LSGKSVAYPMLFLPDVTESAGVSFNPKTL
jgi:hypothetical protein